MLQMFCDFPVTLEYKFPGKQMLYLRHNFSVADEVLSPGPALKVMEDVFLPLGNSGR
jgi:hypothetical protein